MSKSLELLNLINEALVSESGTEKLLPSECIRLLSQACKIAKFDKEVIGSVFEAKKFIPITSKPQILAKHDDEDDENLYTSVTRATSADNAVLRSKKIFRVAIRNYVQID